MAAARPPRLIRAAVGVVAVLVAAAAFGGGDQWVGSHSAWGAWAAQLSLLSAPWLVLAFAAGATRRSRRTAMVLGLAATAAALAGYLVMTLSPAENAHLTVASVRAFLDSERDVVAGALVTGPLFGWLGHRWRRDGSWVAAVVTAGLLCLEPLAHAVTRDVVASGSVAAAEVAAGVLLGLALLVGGPRRRRRAAT